LPSARRQFGPERGVSVIINVAVGSNCEKLSVSKYLPGYSSKRTSLDAVDMSQRCQFRTHAAPKNAPLFDDIVGPSNKRRRNIGAERLGRNKPARFTPQAMRPPASTYSLSPYLRASGAGRRRVSGSAFSRPSATILISKTSSSTARSSGSTSTAPAQKGDSKSGHRPLAWRPDYQNHGLGRRPRQSHSLRPFARSASRQHRC
jgi:hypothetical protein